MKEIKIGDWVTDPEWGTGVYYKVAGLEDGYIFIDVETVEYKYSAKIDWHVLPTKPHKHYHLIKQWAENPALVFQYCHDGGWYSMEPPSWDHDKIRIRLTPKPDVIRWASVALTAMGAPYFALWAKSGDFAHDVKLTFDGDTNKLKAVEYVNN